MNVWIGWKLKFIFDSGKALLQFPPAFPHVRSESVAWVESKPLLILPLTKNLLLLLQMAELISLEGEGLKSGVVGAPNSFQANMAGMNTAKLVVNFGKGPSKPQVMMQNQKDGNVVVSYTTKDAGEYELSVTFDDDHVEGSPFTVVVK